MAQNDALNRLNAMMNNNRTLRMNVPRGGDDFGSGFATGYNMMGTIMDDIRARNDRNRLQKILSGVYNDKPQGEQTQEGQQLFSIGNTNGITDTPIQQQGEQLFSVGDVQKDNSFGSVLGDRGATPVVNQTQQPDYSMKSFMKEALASGMLPSNAMSAYGAYLAPLEADARDRRIRDAMRTLAYVNNGLSKEDQLKALAQINYDMGKEYNIEHLKNLTDLYSKQQSGLLDKYGLMHDPKTLENIDVYINPNAWAGLGNTIGVNSTNYGNNFGNNTVGLSGSEYGGDNENARAIYSYLKNKGYSDNVIAGIMGNLQAESQFNPTIGYGDGGTSGGLAQWHDEQPGVGRWSNLKNFAVNRNMDWKDLGTQLDFMIDEINKNYPNLIQQMSKLSPNEAAILFHDTYERSADNPEQKARRGTYADEIFNGRRSLGNTGVGTYNMPTQGSNINEQVKGLTPEFQQILPTIGGILKNKFGVDGVISSGARNAEHNRQVGGAERSYHIGGDAVDIVLPDNTTPEQYKQIEDYFKSTGQFAEVDNHDKGSGYHLHLGGYKGGNIGNVGGQSYQNQPRQYFTSQFAPQIVSGRGAILNPMVAYKAAVEQAERQRNQYNADRNFNRQVYDSDRNYALSRERLNQQRDLAEMRNALRSGVGGSLNGQQLTPKELKDLEKAKEQMFESGYSLSQTENSFDEDVDGNKTPKKEYVEGMNKFINSLGTIYDNEYFNKDLTKVSSLGVAIDFYKKINENKLGILPETLSEGIARIVSRKRRDINPDVLQKQLLDYIYNETTENNNNNNNNGNNKSNDKAKNTIDSLKFDKQKREPKLEDMLNTPNRWQEAFDNPDFWAGYNQGYAPVDWDNIRFTDVR